MAGEAYSDFCLFRRGNPQNPKWGAEDEVGSLNYLDSAHVLSSIKSIKSGKTFTLQVPMGNPDGDPVWPGRRGCERHQVIDESHWICGKGPDLPGGSHYSDDMMSAFLQGSTQYDALGHVWYDGQLYNGYDANSTIGGMAKASVQPIAEKGIAGRGVLLDIARLRSKQYLDKGETFTHKDLMAAAEAQGIEILKRDIIMIRTGFVETFYNHGGTEFYKDFIEPGLTYSPELVDWFQEMEIPNLVTDTIANEVTIDPVSGVVLPLHSALMRNLGIAFTELCDLSKLARDCAEDGQWDGLYIAAPLNIVNGSGAPVNPMIIK
ncbi:MAG: cyclase family protein [Ketobacter sp.]|nr:MAG: cyclase family protein [Ketobacter sp.]|tara:strand:- start:255 stop:1214 length:960 start_codon:yes stop_codon:yes gene_type:complete